MQEDLIEQKIIVISEEPEIPPKIPTKTKTSRNSKTVKTTQATKNPKAVYTGKSLSEALILHQLIHNMTTDCSLNYKFNT